MPTSGSLAYEPPPMANRLFVPKSDFCQCASRISALAPQEGFRRRADASPSAAHCFGRLKCRHRQAVCLVQRSYLRMLRDIDAVSAHAGGRVLRSAPPAPATSLSAKALSPAPPGRAMPPRSAAISCLAPKYQAVIGLLLLAVSAK